MKNVFIKVSDATHVRLQREADEGGWDSIGTYLLFKSGIAYPAVTVVEHAFVALAQMPVGKTFTMADLFSKEDWSSMSLDLRQQSGRMFCKRVKFGTIPNVEHFKAHGANKYRKVENV